MNDNVNVNKSVVIKKVTINKNIENKKININKNIENKEININKNIENKEININENSKISDIINVLEMHIKNPKVFLPEEVFLFVSRIMPVVSVDLLIKDERDRTLLSWRDDKHFGKGWHLPGGILKLKESLNERVRKVAKAELNTEIQFNEIPITVTQIISDNIERCHFITFLYKCFLPGIFIPDNKSLTIEDNGFIMWHEKCPQKLLDVHKMYRKYIEKEE